jgi:hypothetical protein
LKRSKPYDSAVANQFGNLHERMKFVLEAMQRAEKATPDSIPHDLWHGVFDLETEVRGHVPAEPPFGRRLVKTH